MRFRWRTARIGDRNGQLEAGFGLRVGAPQRMGDCAHARPRRGRLHAVARGRHSRTVRFIVGRKGAPCNLGAELRAGRDQRY